MKRTAARSKPLQTLRQLRLLAKQLQLQRRIQLPLLRSFRLLLLLQQLLLLLLMGRNQALQALQVLLSQPMMLASE